MTSIPLSYYLILGAILFTMGASAILIRRSALVIFMGIEMMLNAVNLTFIAFSRYRMDLDGHSITLFVLLVSVAEATIGLAIVLNLFQHKNSINVDEARTLKN